MTSTRRQKRARKERERAKKHGCPTGKVAYPSRLSTDRALARLAGRPRGEHRSYRCGTCSFWHLTSR